MTDLRLITVPALGANGTETERVLTPPYCGTCGPPSTPYYLEVGYLYNNIKFFPTFTVANTILTDSAVTTLEYVWDRGCVGNNSIVVGGFNAPFTYLVVGNNTLHICDSVDGIYNFLIVRAASDIQYQLGGIKFYPNGTLGPSPPILPALNPDVHIYSMIVPYVTTGVNIQIFFVTAGSISILVNGQNSGCKSLTAGCSSPASDRSSSAVSATVYGAFPLNLGTNTIVVQSTRDGLYTFTVTVLPPDVTALQLTALQTTTPILVNVTKLMTPAFVPGITLGYAMTIPYIYQSIAVSLNFSVFDSIRPDLVNSTVGALPWYTSNDTNTVKYTGGGSQIAPFFTIAALPVGTSTLHLNSSQDGIITIVITRLPPDVNMVQLIGYNFDSLWSTPTAFAPAFAGGQFSYNVTVPFIISGAYLIPTYTILADIVTSDDGVTVPGALLNSTNSSIFYHLVQGVNVFHVTSSLDGNYSFVITRKAPDLTNVTLWGQVSPIIPEVPLSPGLVPVFRGGQFFYTLYSPFIVPVISFDVVFSVPNSLTLDYNGGAGQRQAAGNRSGYFFLTVEPFRNAFTFTSIVDGNYSFVSVPNNAPHMPLVDDSFVC